MIYILTSTKTILQTELRPQESNVGDPVADGRLHLKLKQEFTSQSFNEQQGYLGIAAIAAYVSLNKLDQRQRYRASVNLVAMNNERFNFTKGSSSSGLGYALALFESWWNLVLKKEGKIKYPIFATGEILTSGQINPIGQLADKINSTCAYVEENKETISNFYLCYPEQNESDITPNQREKVIRLGGVFLPVSRLQDLLGELFGKPYDGDPLGRWEPFKGLNSFDYEDSVRFFGRNKDTDRLYDDLKKNNGLLIVAGASGTGKSSLIKAGLIPRLEKENKQFYWAYTTPERANEKEGIIGFIFDELNVAWELEQHGLVIKDLITTFKQSINEGIQQLQPYVSTQTKHCLLYFDQYEEIFSQNEKNIEDISHDLKLIDELARQIPSLDIVLALRNEYLGRLLDNQSLQSPIISNVASQISPDDWYAIVHEQAEFSGISFEQADNNSSLDRVIISEAVQTAYALPMVEFLLEQLYLKTIKDAAYSNTLQFLHYEQMGGLSGAIAYRATQVLKDNKVGPILVAKLFDTFVGLNGESLPYARQVHLKKIAATEPALYELIQEFVDANLIVSVANTANEQIVKLAHDSLFSHWDELKQWVEHSKDYLLWRYSIDGQYNRWLKSQENKDKGADYLLKDKELLKEGKLYQQKKIINDANLSHYLKISLKKKRKTFFSLTFWLIIFPLMLVVLYQWDQHRIKSYYYSAIGERWGIPYGIGELTREEIKHTQNYYRLDFKSNTLKKKVHINAINKLASLAGVGTYEYMSTFEYMENGKLLTEEVRTDTGKLIKLKSYQFIGDNEALVSLAGVGGKINFIGYTNVYKIQNKSEVSRNYLKYTDEGYLDKLEYQNPFGSPVPLNGDVYGKSYKYNGDGLVSEEHSLGEDGELISNKGVYKEKYTYNEKGYLLEHRFFRENGSFNIIKYGYDIYGNVFSQFNFDGNGTPRLNGEGFSSAVIKHDSNGNIINISYYGVNGESIINKDGFSMMKINYHNNLASEIYTFDEHKTPLEVDNSFKKIFLYDGKERFIGAKFYDKKGKPILNSNGFSEKKILYDSQGNKVLESYFGTNGAPILNVKGCAKTAHKYNKVGYITEEACYGIDGELAMNKEGWAVGEMSRDVFGNTLVEAYYDDQRLPVISKDGMAKATFTYDKNGYMNGISYYDTDYSPILVNGVAKEKYKSDKRGKILEWENYGIDGTYTLVNGVAKTTLKYDDNGNHVEVAIYGVGGERIIDKNVGYSRSTTRFDSKNRPIEISSYGILDEPIISIGGFFSLINSYDKNNNIKSKVFYGVNDKPIMRQPDGYSMANFKYDKYGNNTEISYYDTEGEPVITGMNYHKLINEYDDSGSYIKKVFYYNEKDEPIFYFDSWEKNNIRSKKGDEYKPVKYKTSISVDSKSGDQGYIVFINGEYKGVTNLIVPINAGKQVIEVSKTGYLPYKKTVNIKSSNNFQLSVQLNAIPKFTLNELINKSDQGDAIAQKNLGNRYLSGEGVEKNYDTALGWYRKSAKQGYENAQHNIGLMYEQGWGVDKDADQAFEWYLLAANQGFANAQYALATQYLFGSDEIKDKNEALRWLLKAENQGFAPALGHLGEMYLLGNGVEKNMNKALALLEGAAKQGEKIAMGRLANMYYFGTKEVKQNLTLAFVWNKKLADLGKVTAFHKLGYAFMLGRGTHKSSKEAIHWFVKASEGNSIDAAAAEMQLGTIYELGDGVTVDYEKALFWYKKSANRGDIQSSLYIAELYFKGHGTLKNYKQGVLWLKQAALKGSKKASNRLIELGE